MGRVYFGGKAGAGIADCRSIHLSLPLFYLRARDFGYPKKFQETFNAFGAQTNTTRAIPYIKTNGLLVSWLASYTATATSPGLSPLSTGYRLLAIERFSRPTLTVESNSAGGCSPEPKTQH